MTNQVDGAVTGTLQPELGTGTSNIGIIFTSFVGLAEDQPCPACTGATVGATGTCQGGPQDGQACTTDGTTPSLGNTSFDCPPNASADIGASTLPLNLTTGSRTLPLSATCIGSSANGKPCYCADQLQPNQCHDGVCTVDADGEGAYLRDRSTHSAPSKASAPAPPMPIAPPRATVAPPKVRGCLGVTDATGTLTDPIVRTGTPSQATPLQVATFCINATRNSAVNAAAGLAGPGTLRLRRRPRASNRAVLRVVDEPYRRLSVARRPRA